MKIDTEICHNMYDDKEDDYSCSLEIKFPTEKEAITFEKLLQKLLEKK